jgi:uncharacterized membrane protein
VANKERTIRWFLIIVFLLACVTVTVLSIRADRTRPSSSQTNQALEKTFFYRARVQEILENGERQVGASTEKFQRVRATITDKGDYQGQTVEFEVAGLSEQRPYLKVEPEEKVVLMRAEQSQNFFLSNKYRLNGIYWILALFAVLVISFAGRKGIFSLLGLVVSIAVLIFFAVPSLLTGQSPVLITIVAAALILAISLPLAHGFNSRTAVALVSSCVALLLAGVVAWLAVRGVRLFGTGTDEGIYLQFLGSEGVDTRGILLGGIIIGTIGVIDDIVASQVATVAELKKANPSLTHLELFKGGLRVGREHIASLVNTLVLAYAGASLPLFLLFWYYQDQPLWTVINSDLVAEEIVRTVAGSMTLILAVPIATLLAAVVLSKLDHQAKVT